MIDRVLPSTMIAVVCAWSFTAAAQVPATGDAAAPTTDAPADQLQADAEPAPTDESPTEEQGPDPRAPEAEAQVSQDSAQTAAPVGRPQVVVTRPPSLMSQLDAETPPRKAKRKRIKGPDRYQVGLIAGARFRSGASYSLFHDSSAVRSAGLIVGADVVKVEQFHLAIDAQWSVEPSGDINLQQANAQLVTHDLELGLRAHYDVLPWLGLHARVGGGFTQASFELDAGTQPTLQDNAQAPFGTFGAGFTLRTPPRFINRITLGLSFEAGYRLAGPLSIRARPERITSDDDTPIPTARINLGDLGRDAPYTLGSFFVRY